MKRLRNRFIHLIRRTTIVGLYFVVVSGVAGQEIGADCSNDASFWVAMEQVWVEFSTEEEKPLVIAAWVAKSPKQRARGFQGVCPGLVTERPLLFSFPVPVHANFHMTGVMVPLDIAFIDVSRQVIDIQRMALQESNQPMRYYRPNAKIHFALETASGRLDQLRLNPILWRMRVSNRNH